MKTIVWFREDLRLHDNPALHHAATQGDVLPVFILPEQFGGARYWWLHHSLQQLQQQCAEQHTTLILKQGDPAQILSALCDEIQADQVVWNRVYSPTGIAQGKQVKQALPQGLVKSFNGQLLIEPTKILNKQGTPFKVFTPFWRHCVAQLSPPPTLPVPNLMSISQTVESDALDDWALLPSKPDWSAGIAERWQPGELGAQKRWAQFLDSTIRQYKDGRDFPAQHNTSYLSPHLAFGEISPKQLWHDTQEAMANNQVDNTNGLKFLSEIGWREFSRYLLVHFPHLISDPFNARFDNFPWQNNPALLSAWQRGQTGYPIVDAGMRELWHTGYMHNRVRMIVASFLTKHCLTHWQEGMDWFWDTLVDADIGSNTASWQWVAGCGADAAPYFRIFNPILQGEKFDKNGDYIRQWVPELAGLPTKFINKPWEADESTLAQANIQLGKNYPRPIVDHKQARERALEAYQAVRQV